MFDEAVPPQRGFVYRGRPFSKKKSNSLSEPVATTASTPAVEQSSTPSSATPSVTPTPSITPTTPVTPKVTPPANSIIPDTLSTPKISLKNIGQPKVEEKPKEEVPDNVVVNEETCKKIWEEYTAELKQKGNTNAYTVFSHTQPLKVEEGWLHVGYTNPLQESILLEQKWDLQEFFSKKLNGQRIGFKTVLIQQENTSNKKVLYTDEDKLKYLSEKHPVVDELKKRMGLDPNI